jgi:exosortase/archaeosortase family protein
VISFALRTVAWSLGLFGLLRVNWFETQVVGPLTAEQGRLALLFFGPFQSALDVTLACSGAEAIALCAGFILAFPAPWRLRLTGAVSAIVLILALNVVRIGALGQVAGSPRLFEVSHLYIWPAVLTVATSGYVYAWMRFAGRGVVGVQGGANAVPFVRMESAPLLPEARRFIALGLVATTFFIAASPSYLESAVTLSAAVAIAGSAANVLLLLGVQATAMANVLFTSRGAFLVTPECIATPLIPLYVAAVLACSTTWPKRALGVLAAIPVFFVLAVARLLVVALPANLMSSPLFFVHAFNQLMLGALVIVVVSVLRHGVSPTALHRALVALAAGSAFIFLLGEGYAKLFFAGGSTDVLLLDGQGALALLPAFQLGLYVALMVAAFSRLSLPRPFFSGLAFLVLLQWPLFALLRYGALEGAIPHIRDIRAWAVIAPLLMFGLVSTWQARLGAQEAA